MKKKDVIALIFCLLIIASCVFYLLGGFSGSRSGEAVEFKPTETTLNSSFDQEKIEQLHDRTYYGTPADSDIGRSNPFANF